MTPRTSRTGFILALLPVQLRAPFWERKSMFWTEHPLGTVVCSGPGPCVSEHQLESPTTDQKYILCGVLAAFLTSPVPECCDFCSHPQLDTSGRLRETHAHRVRLRKGRGDILKAWPSPVYCGKTSCGGLIHSTESKCPSLPAPHNPLSWVSAGP